MHVASRRVGVLASLAAAVVTTLLTGCDWHIVGSSSASAGGAVASQLFPPVVRYTGRAPTGYTVTFRYEDPKATSVQVQGEWYFSSPAATTTTSSQGLLPSQWRPGDFPIGWPNTGVTAGWPVVEMKRDPRTGVWSYTTPLPSGEFNYWFFVNCPNPGGTGCTGVSDPSNPPWNDRHGLTTGSVEPTSQVYVPSDPAFHTVDYWWQAPTSPRGALVDVTYPMSAKPTREFPGMHYLAVYTPPGYDQHRSTPYPSLYLSAGARGNEVEWSTRADAASILDNLIDKAEVEPMVVVMTNFSFSLGISGTCPTSLYGRDLIAAVIPYVQSHFDVSREPSQRAFAGLSCGGGFAGTLLVDRTSEFGYFGLMSPGPLPLPALSAAQAAAIKHVGVMVGGGAQDPIHSVAATDLTSLRQAGDPPFTDFINGGHDWDVWRTLLRDFLTRVAFRPVKS